VSLLPAGGSAWATENNDPHAIAKSDRFNNRFMVSLKTKKVGQKHVVDLP
jgi:hypothetical protein